MQAEIVERLKQRHRFDEWAGRNTLAQSLFVYGYRLQDEIAPGWSLTREQQIAGPPGTAQIHTLWQPSSAETDQLLKVDVYPCPSRAAAHDLLVRMVGNFQTPAIELRLDMALGDAAFAVPGDTALVFARANLAVFVASVGSVPAPVVEFARQLDTQLAAKPVGPRTRAQPSETRRVVVRESIRPQARVSLDLELPSPDEAPGYWKFFSRSGEVMLSEGQLVYQARGTGAGQVEAYQIQRGSEAAPRRMTIRVEHSDS